MESLAAVLVRVVAVWRAGSCHMRDVIIDPVVRSKQLARLCDSLWLGLRSGLASSP
ncbi:Uncharacterized protein DAT39_000241 [Clarias magur]|uniref:Uncharacterized protein n=1 Tax=Clarias magur TaxID=1594786 RepID=A0A8J4XHD4_CLAMG|nr:Uncharacterized protein DAT39_000241 [Clarias magur]